MAAVTDLTWQQINDAFAAQNPGVDVVPITVISGKVYIDLSILNDTSISVPTQAGVIKALTRLFDLARVSQETANTGKTTGEKLTAFPTPTFGTLANGFAPITRTLTARAVLSSATQIVGTNA